MIPSTLLYFSYKICQTTGKKLKRKGPVGLAWDFAPEISRCQNFQPINTVYLRTSLHCFLKPANGPNGDVAAANI